MDIMRTGQESKENGISKITKEVLSVLNPRTRNVIEKRFGLQSGQPQTLESIGKEYKITRERVRQIEVSGLKNLENAAMRSAGLASFLKSVKDYLSSYGGTREEKSLLADFDKDCKTKKMVADNQIIFLLTLDKDLRCSQADVEFSASWTLNQNQYDQLKEGLTRVGRMLEVKGVPISFEQLVKAARNSFGNLAKNADDRIIGSWMELCKSIVCNPFGEYGLATWSEIHPRGVRDKAYLVLKKESSPLHFLQISRLIEKTFNAAKPVHYQTVHNELIKDRRFVLVGRGTYALSEWGYEPGTVKEVIASILKKAKKPLAKTEILEAVVKQRQVKELTVIFNLQNRKFFKRLTDGRYTVNDEVIIEEA